jgi:hypothetical protein
MGLYRMAVPAMVGLFLGMLVMLELGRQVGARNRRRVGEGANAGIGTVEGSVFGLLGLLLAFTFSGAASRFDARRDLIVQEANDIGTAYLRLDLLPADAQPALRANFREYIATRLAIFRSAEDTVAAKREMARAVELQADIWRQALVATQAAPSTAPAMLLIPALNAMFDIASTRNMAVRAHPPSVVYLLLGVLTLVGGLFAGYGMSADETRKWLHTVGFAVIMAATVYVILDFEFPRLGLIRVDAYDQALVEVQNGMK